MFRIEFFCDDKRVGDALRGLLGIAIGMPKSFPVINAEVSPVTKKIKAKTGGKLYEMFKQHVQSLTADRITPKDTRQWLKSNGFSALSSNYILKMAIAAKVLRPHGNSSQRIYFIIRALPKPAKKKE